MSVTESQRRAIQKWDKEHMTVISCKITKEKAAAFKAACAKLGTNPNAVFSKAADETIKKAE